MGITLKQAAALSSLYNTQLVKRLQKKIKDRGYNPTILIVLKSEYVYNAAHLNQPVIFTAKKEVVILAAGKDIIPTF